MRVLKLPSSHDLNAGSIDPDVSVEAPKARPGKRPAFKVARAQGESRFVGPLVVAIGLVVAAAGAAFALRSVDSTEDPNYVRARESVAVYEGTRPEVERNYDSSVYTEALQSLAKVKPGSASAGPAAELATDLDARVAAFHRRIAKREEAEQEVRQAHDNREQEYRAARQRDLVTPRKDFPECREGGAHAH
jgi:hypothetical protein